MITFIVLFALSFSAIANERCDDLFTKRELGINASKEAYNCYLETVDSAHSLSRMSYLKFFMAEYFMDEKTQYLYDSINLAEKALLKFGPKYSIPDYMKLSPSDRKVLAESLYNYGLATARYVDIKGQWEAIKRMEDIKRSMTSIMRIKEDAVAVQGAKRTLGIFHMKVPAIAGGRIQLSKKFLADAVSDSLYSGELSLYPANNVVYSDLMYKIGKNEDSCHHLNLVASLNESDVRAMDNNLFYETMVAIKDAKQLLVTRKCSN